MMAEKQYSMYCLHLNIYGRCHSLLCVGHENTNVVDFLSLSGWTSTKTSSSVILCVKTNQPDAKCCPPPSALTCTAAFVPLCGLKCDHCSGVTQLKRQQQNGYCEARQHNTTHLWRIRGLSEMDTFDPNTRSLNVRLQHTVRYSFNELNTHNKNLMKTTKPAWGCCFMWLVQICDRWIENSLHQHVNNFALFLFRAFGAPPVSPSTSRH